METPCQHEDFSGQLTVNGLEDTREGSSLLVMVDLKVHCTACGAALTFNLPRGVDLQGVAMSPDGEEVRLSAEVGQPKTPKVRGFWVKGKGSTAHH